MGLATMMRATACSRASSVCSLQYSSCASWMRGRGGGTVSTREDRGCWGRVSPGWKKAKSGSAVLLHRGLDFRRTVRAKMLASDRATRRNRDPIAGPIAKVSSRRWRRVGSRDRTRSDPRGAVEIRWRAVSDQTAFRFPVSPGGFSKQMSASSSVKSGSGAYLGPRSAVYRLLQAQHKVRELLRPLLRLGRFTLLEQTQAEGQS